MLILYSTLGCHLCDQAQSLIYRCYADIRLDIVDIADDDALVERYGIRIPVVQHKETGNELGWPFDEEAFISWYSTVQG